MNKRNYLLIEAIAYSAAAFFCLSLPLWATANTAGIYFSIALFLLFGLLAFNDIQQLRATEKTETVFGPPKNATMVERRSFYKGYLHAILIVFPLFSGIAVFHLDILESGKNTRISPIIALLYKHFGYWPTALFVPLLGLIIVLLLFRRLAKNSSGSPKDEI